MAKLENLKKSITLKTPEEYNIWITDLRQSRRTPKVIHKKKSKTGSKKRKKGTGPKKKRITTKTSNKVMIKALTDAQKKQLAKELLSL